MGTALNIEHPTLSVNNRIETSMFAIPLAGVLEHSALAAVRSSFHDRQQAAHMQVVRLHFHAAFAAEHQALLTEIQHMQA